MRRHLTHTLLFGVAVVALAVPLITYSVAKIELESHFRRQALSSSEVAARQSVYTFLGAPADMAATEAEKVRSWAGADYVEFFDAVSGHSLAQSGERGSPLVKEDGISQIEAHIVRDTASSWYIIVPVVAKAASSTGVLDEASAVERRELIGFLHLIYSKAAVAKLLKMVAMICGLTSAAIAILVIGWGTHRLRALTDPLNTLASLMLQADSRSVRAPPGGAAEVRSIASVFNKLMERIERDRDSLEATVIVRTEALAKASDAAQQAERYKTALLAASTHEMKMPLHLIERAVERSLQELEFVGGPTQKIRDAQRTILRASGDLMSRIEKMLQSARVQGQVHQSIARQIDVEQFIERVRDRVETLLSAHGNGLELCITGDALMHADDEKLFEVVCELLLNACKFTLAGSVRLSLAVGTCLSIEVSDSGCGIAIEEQERIWQEFYQIQRETPPNYPGQGLGLPMVKRLVEQMEGTIALSSVPGEGTHVTVSIPNKIRALETTLT